MKNDWKILTAVLLSACHGAPPEGVYPCHTAADCPSVWTCRDDGLCWIHPLPPDAGMDSGRNCIAEACNGRDDDCDGLTDEGVVTVGPAISASPGVDPQPNYQGALIVPTSNGFVAFGTSGSTSSVGGWTTLDPSGAVQSRMPTTSASSFLDAIAFHDQVLTSGASLTGAAGPLGVSIFDFATSSMPLAFLPVGNASDDVRFPFIARFDGHSATLYEAASSSTGQTLRRAVIDVGLQSTVSDAEILTSNSSAVGLLSTSSAEYVAHRDAEQGLELLRVGLGATTSSLELGSIVAATDFVTGIALGVRDPNPPISPSNPILVVWATSNNTVFLAEITDTTSVASFAVSRVRSISASRGVPSGSLLQTIAVVSAPSDSSISPSHWFVAITGSNGASPPLSATQVFEITESSIREVAIPNEMYVERYQIGIASSNGHIRLAEAGNAGGIVTRSIGCE